MKISVGFQCIYNAVHQREVDSICEDLSSVNTIVSKGYEGLEQMSEEWLIRLFFELFLAATPQNVSYDRQTQRYTIEDLPTESVLDFVSGMDSTSESNWSLSADAEEMEEFVSEYATGWSAFHISEDDHQPWSGSKDEAWSIMKRFMTDPLVRGVFTIPVDEDECMVYLKTDKSEHLSDKAVARLVIGGGYPFAWVDGEAIRKAVQTYNVEDKKNAD